MIRLSTLQAEILRHRLEIPDCIYDVFSDTHEAPGPYPWTEEQVDESCARLMAGLPLLPEAAALSDCDRDVLDDAVSGSTYLGAAHLNVSKLQESNIYRSGCALAAIVGTLIGRTLEYPEG